MSPPLSLSGARHVEEANNSPQEDSGQDRVDYERTQVMRSDHLEYYRL